MTGYREKPVLSFYSQPFLYPVDGKLCRGGRGPQFIFSLQLGSYGHLVEGVSQSDGHVVLRNWHQQGKTGYRLKEGTVCPQGNVATVTSSLVCQGTIMGHTLTICYKPLANCSMCNVLLSWIPSQRPIHTCSHLLWGASLFDLQEAFLHMCTQGSLP